MRFLSLVFGAAFSIGCASAAVAQQSNFESALHQNRYPTASNESICYAKTDTPNTFDLSRLCGSVPLSVTAPMSTGGGYRGSYGGGSSGVCNVPSDIARDGSRCGGRAASERPGGRLGGSYTPSSGSSYTPSYRGSTGGSVYVRPYTRSNGTSVRGYWRRR